jgi:hypothetical protein
MNTIIINDTQNIFNSLLIESLSSNNSCDDKTCLISNELLEKDPINLSCNHSFNYDAIFNEIQAQKGPKKSNLETTRLRYDQLKCPYCRTIQNGILPYRIGYPKIRYVNWPASMVIKNLACESILKSGKRKGQACGKACYEKWCPLHKKLSMKISYKCESILKSGKRKGEKCGCKLSKDVNIQNKKCGKHLKIKKSIT